MRKLLIILILVITSCKTQQDIKISELYNNTYVTLSENFRQPNSDSICLNIPLEFEITVPDDTNKLRFQLFVDNHYKQYINDYKIKYTKNDIEQILYDGIDFKEIKNPEKIKIKLLIENILISKKNANTLLKKYNEESINVDNIKKSDSIKLTPYINFRNENIEIMNNVRKKNSILLMSIIKGNENLSKKYKINW